MEKMCKMHTYSKPREDETKDEKKTLLGKNYYEGSHD